MGWQTSLVKGQVVNIFSFASHRISVATTQHLPLKHKSSL